MMYPTVRGSFGNPGKQESFFGEVDDVLAALAFLKKVDYVDPARIYLGGHSTGGTLALLVAEATAKFRAVFAFGPVANPAAYGAKALTYDPRNEKEARLRAPVLHLSSLSSPTFVIEGTQGGNIKALHALRRASRNPNLACLPVEGATHFDVLFPVNRLIANRIATLGADGKVTLTRAEVQRAFDDHATATREADDLVTIARARRAGVDLDTPRTVRHYLVARKREGLEAARKAAAEAGLAGELEAYKDSKGRPYHVLVLSKQLALGDLQAVFALSRLTTGLARQHGAQNDGWESR